MKNIFFPSKQIKFDLQNKIKRRHSMAPFSGNMHIMFFFNNTSKVKEGSPNLSCELIWGFGSDHWSERFFIDEWMIWSIYALLPWTLWLILPVFSHRQRSMLTADEAGIKGLPQKSCTFSFLSFVFDPLTRFVHFAHFLSLWHFGPPRKKWSVGEGENYFAEIAYCLALNWQSAMSNGRTSLSREVNLSL